MAVSFVGKKAMQMATKKFLNKEMDKYQKKEPGGQWDPYFEYRPNKRGKLKKVKKQIPAYIPEHDAAILAKVRKMAYRLDMQHSILGMRFGWSTVIGAIPELGDAVDVLFAIYVYWLCRKVEGGLDSKTKMKMKAWIAADGLVGLVPIVGDVIDASIKCNARNCRLLEEWLDTKHKPSEIRIADEKVTAVRRRRDPSYPPPAPATVYEGLTDDEDNHHHYNALETRDHSPDHRDRHGDHIAAASGREEVRLDEKSTRSPGSGKPRRKWSSRR